MRRIYETVVPKTIFLLRHGDSFVLPYITFFSIDWNVGMRKQFQRDHNIPSVQGVNRYNHTRLLFYVINRFVDCCMCPRCCQRENIILQLRSILDYNAYVLRMRIHTRGCHPTTPALHKKDNLRHIHGCIT